MGQPPIGNDIGQTETSTGKIIGDDYNQQPIDNSSDSPSTTSSKWSQTPKVATQHSSKKLKQKTTQPAHPYNLRSRRKIDSLGTS